MFQYGDTPLHTSARYGHAGVLRILISAQCKVSEQNKVSIYYRDTFFYKKHNKQQTIKLIFVFNVEQNGDTVLHISAAMARKKLTKIILQAKCNTALKNKVI